MEWVKTTAKTVPQAIEQALDTLGVDESEAEIVVIEEPKKGLFGRIKGTARVEARIKPVSVRPKADRRNRRGDRKGRSRGNGRGRSDNRGDRNRDKSGSSKNSNRNGNSGGKKDSNGKKESAKGERSGSGSNRNRGGQNDRSNGKTPVNAKASGDAGQGSSGSRRNRNRGGRGGGGNTQTAAVGATDASGAVAGAAGAGQANRNRTSKRKNPNRSNTNSKPMEETPVEHVADEVVADHLKGFLGGLTTAFGLEGEVAIENPEPEVMVATVAGQHGLMVGPKGRTLDAIQELARASAQRSAPSAVRIRVDVGGYRQQRTEAIASFALKAADKAADNAVEVKLDPMPASDRKAVHDALTEDSRVETRSIGAEPRRRVLIVPVAGGDAADESEEE